MAKFAYMIVVCFLPAMSAVRAHEVFLGAYYGLAGNNLPPPWKVVTLCKKYNIRRVRLDEPNLDVLQAFRGAGIDLSFGVANTMLTNMKTNKSAVEEWFNTYVEPFIGDFAINYIIVGDKVIPGFDDCILPVMKSLQDLLNAHYLGQVKLTTLVGYSSALVVKGLPSSATFTPLANNENIKDILKFLLLEGSPLMVSVYPFLYYAYSHKPVSLNYVMFRSKATVIHDGSLNYYNLFDATMDAFYTAIEKESVGDVAVVVGETGWPTCGHPYATTLRHAATYNRNFKRHITSGRGTPMKQNIYIEGFIQSLFNENERPEGNSRCYGMFHVDSKPIYPNLFNFD